MEDKKNCKTKSIHIKYGINFIIIKPACYLQINLIKNSWTNFSNLHLRFDYALL